MTYEYPLSWPPGFPRTEYPAQSRFDTPEERVKHNLEFQLDLMDATQCGGRHELRAAPGRPTVREPTHLGYRGCGLFPPNSRSGWHSYRSLINLDHLSLPDVSCLGTRASGG